MIEAAVQEQQINRINNILSGIKNAPDKVFSNAINRALSTAKTEISKGIRQTYSIQAGTINSNSKSKVNNAGPGNMAGSLEYSGNLIPLIQFKVTPKSQEQKTVVASVMKGTGGRIESAYVTNLKSGIGVFERLTSKRETSKQLYGPAVVQMIENEKVLPKAEAKAQETFQKRVDHEIERLINGYGG